MKTNLFQKVMALICAAILLVSVLPAGSAQATEKPGTPSITVKAINGTDVKVTIGKTSGADGYEVWITSDCGYTGYKNRIYFISGSFGDYNYNDNPGDYINAATVEKDGTAVRTIKIKNLSKANVSVKVRAYSCTHYDGYSAYFFSNFSKPKTVKVTAQKKGYKSSYNFSKVKKGDIIKFGTYEQDYPINGKDPIEWVVLDKTKGGIVVMSKYALDCLPYNTEYTDVTWETCTLRKWLNEKFYNAAFNKTEKAMIREATVMNRDNSAFGTDGGNDTKDKIFLLSLEDVTKESYGFNTTSYIHDINRRCAPTKYVEAQGVGIFEKKVDNDACTVDNDRVCNWWLRSPGVFNSMAGFVLYNGFVDYGGDFTTYGSTDNCAVRPVMYLKLKSE